MESAWWTSEMKEAIEKKSKAYKKMLQIIMAEEIKVRRATE